jgi:6-phosphogluconate dehydrogenase
MKRGLNLSNKEIGDILTKWNKGVLDSFLIEITRDIMYFNDDDGTPLVEKILDQAGQKGTGKWTAVNAFDLGMPVTLIAEAVFARCLSSIKQERTEASEKLKFVGNSQSFEGNKEQFLDNLEQALYASKIISYAQGFMLMQEVRDNFPLAPHTVTNETFVGRQGVRVEAQQAVNCFDVERWLHHPLGLLEGYHFCVSK